MGKTPAIHLGSIGMTRFLIAALAVALFTATSQAALIAYENFESYTAGADLIGGNGGTGWDAAWAGIGDAGDVTVESGVIPLYGKSMQITDIGATSGIVSRALDESQTGTVYVGMLFRVGSLQSDGFVQFAANNGGNKNQGASMGVKEGDFFARVNGSNNTDSAGTFPAAGTTYQLVLKIDKIAGTGAPNYNRSQLFIDQATEGTADAVVSQKQSNTPTISAFKVRTFGFESGDEVYVDELRIATTYAEALIPAPAALPAGLVLLGIVALRRRK